MAMRGGSVASYVRIGTFRSPLIRAGQADCLLALSAQELELNRHLLRPDTGRILVNSAGARPDAIDATRIATRLGTPLAANLVVLGAACARRLLPCSVAQIRAAAAAISPARYQRQNSAALEAGAQAA